MANSFSIEERIAHFLRVAENAGATQAERDIASSQAEKLMIKHAIDRAMLSGVGEQKKESIIVGRVVAKGGSGTYAYHTMLAMTKVASALGLKAFYTDNTKWYRASQNWSYAEATGAMREEGKGPHLLIQFAGYESDVVEAERLIRSLMLQSTIAMKSWWKEGSNSWMDRQEGYHARCEFLKYFGEGAATRIRDERKVATEETTGSALVLVNRSKEVHDWADSNLGLRSSNSRRSESGYGRGAGYAAGKNANTGSAKGLGGSRGSIGS